MASDVESEESYDKAVTDFKTKGLTVDPYTGRALDDDYDPAKVAKEYEKKTG